MSALSKTDPTRPSRPPKRAGMSALLLTLMSFAFSNLALAQGSIDRLLDFTTTLESFSAIFDQTVYDADSNPLQKTRGTVRLKRPGRFIWQYDEPSPQTIVADGQKIWLYDKELEQVTVSTIEERAAGSPLALLMGESPVDEEFTVKALGLSDGIDWFELTPKTRDSDFEMVFLGLNDDGLAVMELRDTFGQATQILFKEFKSNISIPDSLFEFIPPAGVDVVGQG